MIVLDYDYGVGTGKISPNDPPAKRRVLELAEYQLRVNEANLITFLDFLHENDQSLKNGWY